MVKLRQGANKVMDEIGEVQRDQTMRDTFKLHWGMFGLYSEGSRDSYVYLMKIIHAWLRERD